MLLMALVASNSGETPLKPAAGQEIFYRANDHRAQRSRMRLEALFVCPDVTVKISLKQLIIVCLPIAAIVSHMVFRMVRRNLFFSWQPLVKVQKYEASCAFTTGCRASLE